MINWKHSIMHDKFDSVSYARCPCTKSLMGKLSANSPDIPPPQHQIDNDIISKFEGFAKEFPESSLKLS